MLWYLIEVVFVGEGVKGYVYCKFLMGECFYVFDCDGFGCLVCNGGCVLVWLLVYVFVEVQIGGYVEVQLLLYIEWLGLLWLDIQRCLFVGNL